MSLTLAAMLQRHRYVSRAALRRPRAVERVAPPHGAELAYARVLHTLSDAQDAAILATLRAERLIRTDAIEPLAPLPSQVARVVAEIQRKLTAMSSHRALVGAIDAIAARVGTYSRDAWRAQLKRALGIDLTSDPDLSRLVASWRAQQLTRVTALSQSKIARVRDVLEGHLGARVENVAGAIVDALGITRRHATLVAVSETLGLNANIAQARHEAAGIVEYVWSSSGDQRVRPAHKALNGTIQRYDRPPFDGQFTGNPGSIAPRCRCVAVPRLEGVGS